MMAVRTLLRRPVVVVLGATGGGKSKLALELGREFNGEIISADSMQVYKGLDIITNKVTPEEQEQCPHHAIGIVHPLQRFTVVDFRNRVIPIIDGLLSRGRIPIIVGGTNYYIEALLWKVLLANEESSVSGLLFETKGEAETLRLKCGKALSELSLQLLMEDQSNTSDQEKTEQAAGLPHLERRGNVCQTKLQENQSVNRTHTDDGLPCADDQSEIILHSCMRTAPSESGSHDKLETLKQPASDGVERIVGKLGDLSESVPTVTSAVSESSSEGDDGPGIVEVRVGNMTNSGLHELLSKIDPDMAKYLHPNDRRKVVRSLQVYEQHGVCHSELLHRQRAQEGGSHLGGPLRYPHACVFWVQTEQTVLDARLDKRVDAMMDAGLLRELEDFHSDYNQQRLEGSIQEEELYTQGIFQSIGFKEFHPYLTLASDVKRTDEGQRALRDGTDKLKTATRQYARRQHKWIRNRFLKRGANSPAVYALDATHPEAWDTSVLQPAIQILQAVMEGRDSPISPLPREEPEVNDLSQTFVCDVCDGRRFVGHQQWSGHLKSRRHQKRARKRKLREYVSSPATKKPLMTSSPSDVETGSVEADEATTS